MFGKDCLLPCTCMSYRVGIKLSGHIFLSSELCTYCISIFMTLNVDLGILRQACPTLQPLCHMWLDFPAWILEKDFILQFGNLTSIYFGCCLFFISSFWNILYTFALQIQFFMSKLFLNCHLKYFFLFLFWILLEVPVIFGTLKWD